MTDDNNNAKLAQPLVLLGPPGAGKGTQAREIMKAFSVPQISTGDMFRDHVKRETDLGKQAKAIMERGELVSDDIVSAMVADRIQQPDCAAGMIFDGFPRTQAQAERLEALLAEEGFSPAVAMILKVGYDKLVRRLSGRRTCAVCGEIYNVFDRPPKIEGRCDLDDGELLYRADDSEEVVGERIRAYDEQTKPLVDFYRQRGLLLEVEGEQAPDVLTKQILQLLETYPTAKAERGA